MTTLNHNLEQYDVRDLRKEMGFTHEAFSVVLDTSSKTIERWEKSGIPSNAPLHTMEELHKIKELCQLGTLVYGDSFSKFLRTPMRALGGKTPYRMLMGGEIDNVYKLLVAAYEGVGF